MYLLPSPAGEGAAVRRRMRRPRNDKISETIKAVIKKNKNIKPFSKSLRIDMTPEEKHIWYDFLQRLPVTVHRQYVIGNYIVDFIIFSSKIIIEIDGRQHKQADNKLADDIRDAYMSKMGFRVLRYTNVDINTNFTGVASDILKHIGLTFADLKASRNRRQ